MAVMTDNPKYSEYLTNEGKNDHIDVKKSTEWAAQKEISISLEVVGARICRMMGISTSNGEVCSIGILDNFRENKGEITFEECYRWVICLF